MKTHVRSALALSCCLAVAMPAAATYQTFFGEDVNAELGERLASFPNSHAARASFMSTLQTGVGTHTFESSALGPAPAGGLPITFPTVNSESVTAKLLPSGGGQVIDVPAGTAGGLYSVPVDATLPLNYGNRLWSVVVRDSSSSTFEIEFSQAIAAFGFFGVDVGDFGANIDIELLDASGNKIAQSDAVNAKMNYTAGTGGGTDGSVFFFGFSAQASDPLVSKIRFITASAGAADTIGFDNFTVALRSQLDGAGPNNPAPEPGSLALMGLALAGIGASLRKRRQ